MRYLLVVDDGAGEWKVDTGSGEKGCKSNPVKVGP